MQDHNDQAYHHAIEAGEKGEETEKSELIGHQDG